MSMKLRGSPENKLLFVGFNQDFGCFACGMTDGFRIYNSDPLKEKDRRDMGGSGMAVVEMLFRCNYIAFVGDGNNALYPPNKVTIWDDLKSKSVVSLEFSNEVKAVRLRRDRIVVVMQEVVKVYTFTQNPQQLHAFETAQNPSGLCVLCPNSDNSLLAFPARKIGHVELVDLADSDRPGSLVPAHENTLACMSLNASGSLLATASVKGTLIRLFDTKSGAKLQELRRGSNHAIIYSINFNIDSSMLCVSSNHNTVHIFNLKHSSTHHPPSNPTHSPSNSTHLVTTPTHSSFPPTHSPTLKNSPQSKSSPFSSLIPDYFSSTWSFAKFHINSSSKIICCFSSHASSSSSSSTASNYVIVVSGDGSYYKYRVSEKGECSRQVYLQYNDDQLTA